MSSSSFFLKILIAYPKHYNVGNEFCYKTKSHFCYGKFLWASWQNVPFFPVNWMSTSSNHKRVREGLERNEKLTCREQPFWSGIPRDNKKSSETEIKFRRCLFKFFIKREIRHFHIVVVQKLQRYVQKMCDARAKSWEVSCFSLF